MRQAAAIFLDAYRELNARKMFWITLVISGLVVCTLLGIGLTEDRQLKILFWDMPFPLPADITLADLLKATFVSLGVGFWLTWAAAILALVSTASIFPDFVSSGSIDLVLAKPIARTRLFILKYLSGLLFVALQVGAFSLAAFLIIGLRAGAWEVGLFLAVPIVVIFFSYLFCVCAAVGILTRSTIAALLLTILFWLLVFGVNTTDSVVMMPRVLNETYVEKLQQRIETAQNRENPDQNSIASLQKKLADATESADTWRRWHGLVLAVKTVLPKTDETIKLLQRWLVQSADLPESTDDEDQQRRMIPFMTSDMFTAGVRGPEVIQRIEQTYLHRPVWWVLGTSLLFELVVLTLAGWLFSRRDF